MNESSQDVCDDLEVSSSALLQQLFYFLIILQWTSPDARMTAAAISVLRKWNHLASLEFSQQERNPSVSTDALIFSTAELEHFQLSTVVAHTAKRMHGRQYVATDENNTTKTQKQCGYLSAPPKAFRLFQQSAEAISIMPSFVSAVVP